MSVPRPCDDQRGEGLEAALVGLLEVSHTMHPDDLPTVVRDHARLAGGEDAAVYLVDVDQRQLVPLLPPGEPSSEMLGIEGTVAGRVYRMITPVSTEGEDGGRRLWLPLLDGTDRLGVLAVTVPAEDDETTERMLRLAGLVGHVVHSKQLYGDRLIRHRRLRPMDLAAELRWALLPPLTMSTPAVSISGILEPAYEIAGDAFDYGISGDLAQVAIVDAMGHGLEAARIANLAVGAYRNARRAGLGLVETYRFIDQVIADAFGDERFVTGQLGELDTRDGLLRWLNAGHPQPILLRGNHDVGELASSTCLPLGLGDVEVEVSETSLEPGDMVLFFTDGVTEARSPDGELFGRERLGDLFVRAAASEEPPAEMMRRLCHAVADHESTDLRDDATLLVIRWSGEAGA